MDIDFFGHSTIVVRSNGTNVLFDPLFFDEHQDSLYRINPPRELDFGAFPTITTVVLSHRHSDHFDLPSLTLLPREVPIFIPDDPVMLAALHDLGFENVHQAVVGTTFQVGDLRLTPTPPAAGAVESGFLISDGSHVLWNMIDTVPSPASIAQVKGIAPVIDLAIVPWQPLLDDAVGTPRSMSFPLELYQRFLENAWQVDSKAVALGAFGFVAGPENDWLNQTTFPVMASRFRADLAAGNPRYRENVFEPTPGDQISIGTGATMQRQRAAGCRSTQPELRPAWRPWARHFASLVSDLKVEGGSEAKRFREFLEQELLRHIQENAESFYWHRSWQVRRRIGVCCRDAEHAWVLRFDGEDVSVSIESDPLVMAHTIITGDALLGLLTHERSWSSVVLSGHYWQTDYTYRVGAATLTAPRSAPECPLFSYFGGDTHLAAVLRRQVQIVQDENG